MAAIVEGQTRIKVLGEGSVTITGPSAMLAAVLAEVDPGGWMPPVCESPH